MKIKTKANKLRRIFFKNIVSSLLILSCMKYDLFFSYFDKIKLKKNKNFVWYLNNDD